MPKQYEPHCAPASGEREVRKNKQMFNDLINHYEAKDNPTWNKRLSTKLSKLFSKLKALWQSKRS